MKKSLSQALFFTLLAATLSWLNPAFGRTWTTNYVGTNTAGLQTAIRAAQTNGGYVCFTADATFTLLEPIVISTNFWFDGGTNRITLSGDGKVRVFSVSSNGNLSLFNISVIKGSAILGGGLYNDGGSVLVDACTFQDNKVLGKPGLDGADGTDDHFDAGNGTDGRVAQGGAIFSRGNLYIYDSLFLTNRVAGGDGGNGGVGAPDPTQGGKGGHGGSGGSACGGAIYSFSGTNWIKNTIFMGNDAFGGNGGSPGAAGTGTFDPRGAKGGPGGTSLGAAICSQSPMDILDCAFVANNVYGGNSAGVFPNGDGSSEPANDGASGLGGAVYNAGSVYLENCTFFQNLSEGGVGGNVPSYHARAGDGGDAGGGALASVGSASAAIVVNCTIATNSAAGGASGTASNTDNNGLKGRSMGGALYHNGGTFKLYNTIVARGTNGVNCWGAVTDGGYNLSSDASCKFTAPGSQNNVNPMLEMIKDNGGGTLTMALRPGSPALGALGTNVYYPTIDQRGVSRPQGLKADIGAFENEAAKMLPIITNQPSNIAAAEGANVSFSTLPGGQGPFWYQWTWNSNAIAGATNATLLIPSVQKGDAGTYKVIISNEYGSVPSSDAVLTVFAPVKITAQPQSTSVLLGDDASFSVSAIGDEPLQYQWYFANAALASQTNSALLITNVQPQNAGTYRVTISNSVSRVTSSNVNLRVNTPASIVAQPQDKKVLANTSVTLSVQAQGDQPLSYQWTKDGLPIINANAARYTVTVGATNVGGYAVVVTNLYGAVTSAPVSIAVCHLPVITAQPESTSIVTGPGYSAMLSVGVKGTEPIAYQWYRDGVAISAETNFTLYLTNVQAGTKSTYAYSVSVVDAVGSVLSSNALLTVCATPSITAQPRSQVSMVGSNVTLTVVATGDQPLACQWTWNGTPLPDATNFSLTLSGAQLTNSGSYAAIVTNNYGTATSSNAIVTVSERVSLVDAPQNRTVPTGKTVVFAVSAAGRPGPLFYQWLFNNHAVSGATNVTLVLTNVQARNAGFYKVVVSNAVSSIATPNATLKVLNAPKIVSVSKSQSVLLGSKVSLRASVSGAAPLYYQWQCQGTNIPGANKAAVILPKVAPQHAGVYTVVVSNLVGKADSQTALSIVPPPPVIKSPTASQFTNTSVQVTGTVPVGSQITNIALTLNGAALPPVTVADNNTWSANLDLTPGTNRLTAVSQAAYGSSAPAARTYLLVAKDRLTLTFSNGSVSPNLNGQRLQLGQQYTLKATPARGMIFSNWSGGVTSFSPVLTFTMRSNLVIHANFEPDPFASRKGAYLGLFYDTNALQNGSSGFMSLTLQELGLFSAKLLQGTNTYSFTGQFDASGVASSNKLSIRVVLDSTGGNPLDPLQGRISGPGWTAPFRANRIVYNATNSAAVQGKYTLLTSGSTDSSMPAGSGALAVSVGANGLVTYTGALADGTALTGGGTLCAGDQWPFYAPLYGGRGGILGWIEFATNSAGLSGDLNWIYPSNSTFYPSGFSATLPIQGSAFHMPSNSLPVLAMTNALAVLTGGNLDMSVTNALTLGSDNVFVNNSTNLFVLKIDATNGLVSGRFYHPATKVITPIQGAVLQNQDTIAGYFLGTNQSGSLLVTP